MDNDATGLEQELGEENIRQRKVEGAEGDIQVQR